MHISVHNAHSSVKAKRTLAVCILHGMSFDDRPDEAKRLEQARIARGFKTAAAAAEYFGWNYETYAQHENGTRGLSRAADRYGKAYRTEAAWLRYGVGQGPVDGVPLKGKIGAGQVVIAIDPEDLEQTVEAPAERRPETVAAIVSGDSMYPAFHDGWIIYWSKQLPPEELVNLGPCVVQLANDEIYVKLLTPGTAPNLWTLTSINAANRPMEDQVVSWAAPIDWIKVRR